MSIFQHVFGRRLGSVFSFSAFSFLALLLFFSCSGLFDGIKTNPASSNNNPARTGSGKIVTVRGTIHSSFTDGGALPEEYAGSVSASRGGDESRSALPEIPETGITYDVTATTIGSTPELTVDNGQVADGVVSIGLVTGHRWSVTVTMKQTSGGVTREILTDTYTMEENTTLTDELPLPEFDFYLEPLEYEESGGGGFISLQMTGGGTGESAVYNNVAIVSVTKNGIDVTNDWSGGNWSGSSSKLNVQRSLIATKTGVTITPGVYEVTLHFTKGNLLVYYTTQSITVFKNMTTSRWVSGGGSNSPISSSGTFEVTTALVNACTQNEFYVGSPVPGIEANDETGTGNPYKPFATVKGAVVFVNSLPNRDASQNPYIIRVKDGTTENVEQSITIGNNISIECWKNSLNDKAGTATLKWTGSSSTGTSDAPMITINSDSSLLIDGNKLSGGTAWSGLVIDGNKYGEDDVAGGDDDRNMQGIKNRGLLHMEGGEIKNFAYNVAAGIVAVYSSGTFEMDGGVIHDNIITTNQSNTQNVYGIIWIASGEFIMKDGIIRENDASSSTNADAAIITLQGDSPSFEMKDGGTTEPGKDGGVITGNTAKCGGGVNVYSSTSTFKMTNGSITGNTATSQGGGVKVYSGTFDMEGGSISGNTAAYGGGINNYNGNVYIHGTAVIGNAEAEGVATAEEEEHSNKATNSGGGIYNGNKVYIGYKPGATQNAEPEPDEDFSGGIYYNYAGGSDSYYKYGGGGIYNQGTMKIACGEIKYNAAAQYGGGILNNNYQTYINGGEISSNEVVQDGGLGGGIYTSQSFSMSGSAYIPAGNGGKNDVYLTSGVMLNVTGELTHSGVVATITPSSYPSSGAASSASVAVVEDSGVELSSVVGKFVVTPNDGKNYRLNSEGKIEEKPTVTLAAANAEISTLTESREFSISGTLGEEEFSSLKSALDTLTSPGSGFDWQTGPFVSLDLSCANITELPSNAFSNCNCLKEVILPDGLTSIPSGVFWCCDVMESIYVPSSVTSIDQGAFYACTANIDFAGNTTLVRTGDAVYSADGKQLLFYCKRQDQNAVFTVPAAVEEICNNAFSDAKIKQVIIEDNSNLTRIGENAFHGCSELESINIPSGVTEIGDYAFSYNGSISELTLPSNLVTIGRGAFTSTSISNLVIPDKVTTIGSSAFRACYSLTTITLPKSINEINENAFEICNSIDTVYYKGSESDRESITIGTGNTCLTSVDWIYNYSGN